MSVCRRNLLGIRRCDILPHLEDRPGHGAVRHDIHRWPRHPDLSQLPSPGVPSINDGQYNYRDVVAHVTAMIYFAVTVFGHAAQVSSRLRRGDCVPPSLRIVCRQLLLRFHCRLACFSSRWRTQDSHCSPMLIRWGSVLLLHLRPATRLRHIGFHRYLHHDHTKLC